MCSVWLIRSHLPLEAHTLSRFFHLTVNDRPQESPQRSPIESLQVTVLFEASFCYHQWWFISVCQQTKREAEEPNEKSHPVAKWAVSLYQSEVVLKFSVVRDGKIKRWRLRWAYWTVGCGNKLHNSECQSSDEPSPLYLHQPWSTVLRPKNSYMYISTFMFIRIKLWGDALYVYCVDGKLQAIDEMFIYRYQWVEYMEMLALGTAKVRDRRQLAGIV